MLDRIVLVQMRRPRSKTNRDICDGMYVAHFLDYNICHQSTEYTINKLCMEWGGNLSGEQLAEMFYMESDLKLIVQSHDKPSEQV